MILAESEYVGGKIQKQEREKRYATEEGEERTVQSEEIEKHPEHRRQCQKHRDYLKDH